MSRSVAGLPPRVAELEVNYLRPYRWHILGALAAMLGQSLFVLPLPWLQGRLVDALGKAHPTSPERIDPQFVEQLVLFTAISVACLLSRIGLGWCASIVMNRVSLEFVRTLTDALHRKLQRLPLAYFDRQETGQLMARLTNDVGTLLIFLSAGSLQVVADLVLAVGVVVGMLFLSWPLALVSLLAIPLFFWNQRRHAGRVYRLSRVVQDQTAELYSLLSERISAMRTVRLFGTEDREIAAFEHQLGVHTNRSQSTLGALSWQNFTALLIAGWATAFLVCLAAVLVQSGRLSTGDALAFATYLGLLYQPLVRLTQFAGGMSATAAAADRISEILAEPETSAFARVPKSPRRVRGHLRLRQVSFGYLPTSPRVIDDIQLRVEPGMTVGICGPSGSGKSTLLSLLPRLYDLPPECPGRIWLDGRDVRSYSVAQLRRHVVLVPQHARLFEGTIRSNVTYAVRDASEAEIRRALEAVDLSDLIDAMPRGLDTWVGERGASLSGGQRQRLALARGILAQSPVLLLDDCTSALDASTQRRVLERIAKFTRPQTRILVSHQPDSLIDADWLVLLEHGRIVRQGPPRKLLRSSPSPSSDLIQPAADAIVA
ncbi:MAG: ABC transporter ATP-binding protein [Pirellulaceae bacterium]